MKSVLIRVFALLFLPLAITYCQLWDIHSSRLRIISMGRSAEYLIPHSIRCFENAQAFNSTLFQWTPSERVTILMQDLRDYGNAAALTIPRNLVSLSIAPYSYVFETSPANERINSTINHELVHLATMDKAGVSDSFFRGLFLGKPAPVADNPLSVGYRYLTSPRWSSPRWYIEGIAVFLETWNAGGLGRAQGAYDEMVFRTQVKEGRPLYDVLGIEAEGTAVDFQAGAVSYMYGTRFMSYLALEYSPEKLIQWVSRDQQSDAYFASQFRRTFGRSLAAGWEEWKTWEERWQSDNLDSLRKNPITQDRRLSQRSLGSISRAFLDLSGRKIYAAIRYPGQVAALAAININDGSIERLADVKGSALYYVSSVAYDAEGGKLFFSSDNNDWRDLWMLDLQTGESSQVMDEGRVGDLVFSKSDKSVWGVRHDNGFSTIVRIPPPYNEWNQIYTLPYGKDVFDLDISDDGNLLSAGMTEISGQQQLVLFDVPKLRAGDRTYKTLFDFEQSTPSNFVFAENGKYLIGSSYYTGVSNIYRYSFASNEMEIMTNAETGYFRPIPYSSDSLIAFRYTADGFLPVKLRLQGQTRVNAIRYLGQAVIERHPVLTRWKLNAPSPSVVNVDSLNVSAGEYHPLWNISLGSAYPVLEGYKDVPAIGWRFNFSDPILLHNMDVTLSYSPDQSLPADERLHFSFNHKFWEWTIRANYDGGNFYDLFGPTKVTRKGYSGSVQYKKYILYDDPKTFDYTLAIAGYGGLERLPEFQNVKTLFDRFATFRAALTYQFFNRSIGAVDDEKGLKWQLISRNTIVNGTVIPRLSANVDYGIALPIDHSSVWIRGAAGFSSGSRTEPFANFYFGAFGNNWVDYQDAKRFREDYSFPGIGLNAIGGTNYGKAQIEWLLPPVRFSSFGSPGLYCNWARISFFATALSANIDDGVVRTSAADAGGQLDFRISFLSSFESTLSFGYAIAAEQNQRPTGEFMVSLKLLK